MRNIIFILICFISSFCFAIQSQQQILNNAFMLSPITTVLSTSQSVTEGYLPLGSPINTKGVNKLAAWITKTINDSTDLRFILVGALTEDGVSYLTHKGTVSSGVETIDDHYIEIADDNSNAIKIEFDLNRLNPYSILLVQADSVGSTAATIDTVSITKGR